MSECDNVWPDGHALVVGLHGAVAAVAPRLKERVELLWGAPLFPVPLRCRPEPEDRGPAERTGREVGVLLQPHVAVHEVLRGERGGSAGGGRGESAGASKRTTEAETERGGEGQGGAGQRGGVKAAGRRKRGVPRIARS